jgi:hypothetical protein
MECYSPPAERLKFTYFPELSATGVLAATGYFGNVRIFCILAVLATVVAVTFSHTVANTMCTFVVVVCHYPSPAVQSLLFGG